MSLSELESSPLLALVYAAAIFATMLGASFVLTRTRAVADHVTASTSRYGCLDGFRGLLAVGVMVHHSFASYGYFTRGVWSWSQSPLLNELGQTTVALFFMITAFLFTRKAMTARVNWRGLYVSRIARLLPLYAVIVTIVFVEIFVLTHGVLQENRSAIFREFAQWLSFACFGTPDVNGYPMSWTLIAGVNWSLKYELMFYLFAIPALHYLSQRLGPSRLLGLAVLALSVLLASSVLWGPPHGLPLYGEHFLCGIVAANLYDRPRVFRLLQGRLFRVMAGLAAIGLTSYLRANGAVPVLLTFVLFLAVLGGLSFGGLLRSKAALWLGDISYGIYLIHGMVLWITLSSLKAAHVLSALDLFRYSLVVFAVGTIVLLLASASYIRLEKPAMDKAKSWDHRRKAVGRERLV